MTTNIDNNAFELNITPSRKRKRDIDKICSEGLDNCGFSTASSNFANRENQSAILFVNNAFLEEKSIAEIASLKKLQSNLQENPYEIRRPPKKKKKSDIEEACFVNPALNLNVPEKQFNPFEVKRPSPIAVKNNCFVNPGLNIRTIDNQPNFNPFEVSRECGTNDFRNGIENPALELPKSLAIALPFTPTVGCRIDFSKLPPLDTLTPTKLLEEKLVFSPIPVAGNIKSSSEGENSKYRQSLSVISEEIDIGKELDCYQLELENSINEAKFKKAEDVEQSKTKVSFEMCLEGIKELDDSNLESDSLEINSSKVKPDADSSPITPMGIDKKIEKKNIEIEQNLQEEKNFIEEKEENDQDLIEEIKEDDQDEESFDFKKPTPFIRCYRKTSQPIKTKSVITETKNTISFEDEKLGKHHQPVTDMLRKSIRKIMHSVKSQENSEKTSNQIENKKEIEAKTTKESQSSHKIFETVRQSLRKKFTNKPKISTKDSKENSNDNEYDDDENSEKLHEISIIDNNFERKIFRSNPDDIKVDHQSTFRKSIRKSSRYIKSQVCKTVLKKKNENYDLKK